MKRCPLPAASPNWAPASAGVVALSVLLRGKLSETDTPAYRSARTAAVSRHLSNAARDIGVPVTGFTYPATSTGRPIATGANPVCPVHRIAAASSFGGVSYPSNDSRNVPQWIGIACAAPSRR